MTKNYTKPCYVISEDMWNLIQFLKENSDNLQADDLLQVHRIVTIVQDTMNLLNSLAVELALYRKQIETKIFENDKL